MLARLVMERSSVPLLALLLAGCGGGGGGGGGGSSTGPMIQLDRAFLARLLEGPGGARPVSPLTVVRRDPETGAVLPDSVAPLATGVDVDALVELPLDQITVIPRDGAIVLEFSGDVDPASIVPDDVTPAGTVVTEGGVQLRTPGGRGVPSRALVLGNRIVVVAGPDPDAFAAGPLWIDGHGDAQVPPEGSLLVQLATDPAIRPRGAGGGELRARTDGVGEPSHPLALTPGNELVDFIAANGLLSYPLAFHGFLPELWAPRIVREYRASGRLDFREGDTASSSAIVDRGSVFRDGKGGRGEWADARLILRPGRSDEESHQVLDNTVHRVDIVGTFAKLPQDGDAFALERLERFEPDPTSPIDPEQYDPDDPENANNQDLRWFAWFEEVNPGGSKADLNGDGRTRYSAFERVPSFAVLKLQLDVPMTAAGPFEALRVTASAGDPGAADPMGEVALEQGGLVLAWSPSHREASGERVHGFVAGPAGTVKTRTVALRIVPEIPYLEAHLAPDQLAAFLKQGLRGLVSRAGRAAGFPDSAFDPASPAITYAFDFECEVPPGFDGPEIGAQVHLFQGIPDVVTDPGSGRLQVHYQDRPELYGPVAVELNQQTNGYLSPKEVVSLSRLLDNLNPPPGESFLKNSSGPLTPLISIAGARFQHIYPPSHCLPSQSLQGAVLDLVRLCWSPWDPSRLTRPPDVWENISVLAANSSLAPTFADPHSGLGSAFDPDSFDTGRCFTDQQGPHYDDHLVAVVDAQPYVIDPAKLIHPPGNPNRYLPWPDFNDSLAWDTDKSMLLEYRVRPQQTQVAYQASFATTFLPGSPPMTRFRVFSYATSSSQPLDPDSKTDGRALCASGPDPGWDYGDNARYFAQFDYLTLTARIESAFIGVSGSTAPDYLSATTDPPLADLSPEVDVHLSFRGATDAIGSNATGWSPSIDVADGFPFLQLRLILRGSRQTHETATLDSVVIAYHR